MIYRTMEGDVLDAICYEYYGDEHGTTEVVLSENQGLAALPPVLPAGIVIVLPDLLTSETVSDSVSLWD